MRELHADVVIIGGEQADVQQLWPQPNQENQSL